jgi:hypothetical protein
MRTYFKYQLDGVVRIFLLMPDEYTLYTNEYWNTKPVVERFENAAGVREGISDVSLVLEIV